MIIIDTDAEDKLHETLERLYTNTEDAQCLYFALRGEVTPLYERLTESVRTHLLACDPHLYLCEGGDAFIITPEIPTRESRSVMLDMADATGAPVTDTWVQLFNLPQHNKKLHAINDPKLERRRKEAEALKQQSAQQQAERKRHSILNPGNTATAEQIGQRRKSRKHAELMMIEDDVFSQRLVENVLQKKYAMTCLKEATRALETYANLAPDILFLDINLPNVSGHELLERIIAMDPNAYVIMLSGNADRENISQAMAHGAKGFVAKPFSRDKIFQYIDRCPTIAKL